jgi:NADH-quinone oxidoreductase subunit G
MVEYLTLNGKRVLFDTEKSILEVIRRENIELPTFCYHSELGAYGSCRLCMVEVVGLGIVPACSTFPKSGMEIKTNTEQIMDMRKIVVELLLANHHKQCTTCVKSGNCKLQILARRLGIETVRFKNVLYDELKDMSTYALVKETGKCILCGNCVRFCDEIQSIGALYFANRGAKSVVCTSFEKELEASECVYCGQCASVCPTGAIVPKFEINAVWRALSDVKKKVVISIAPAVRAAINEVFGISGENGTEIAGKIVTALKSIGFDKVFDISFSADMTVVEETNEFLRRIKKNIALPMFTSCCSAWVRFVERYYPDFIPNLSTCRSPQGMYGAVARKIVPGILGIPKEDLVIVSVMPCTAKKYEARRPQLAKDGIMDVDYVLTTQELAIMIESAGLCFNKLKSSAFDMPLGFKTGGGIIFGNSGGVTESILRNIVNIKSDRVDDVEEFKFVRGGDGLMEAKINLFDMKLNIAIVYGLKNARTVLSNIKTNKTKYDFVEVMACPGGCIGGAGQPIYTDLAVREMRTKVLYENDKTMKFHKSNDNVYVKKMYKNYFENPGSQKAREYLHTNYKHHGRLKEVFEITDFAKQQDDCVKISICFGNKCVNKGSKEILKYLVNFAENEKYRNKVNISASICFGECSSGPNVKIAGKTIQNCTIQMLEVAIQKEFK